MLVVAVHQLKQQLTLRGEFATLAAISGCECGWRLHEGQDSSGKT
jgi:hypothetical protein